MPERGKELTVESVWQLSEGEARLGDDRRSAVTANPDSNLLLLFPLVLEGTEIAVHTGDPSPMRGWVPGPGRLRYIPAPMVRLWSRHLELWKAHLVTVLVPFAGADAPRVLARAARPGIEFADRTAGRLDLQWPDGSSDVVIWSGRLEEAIDRQRGVDTDAGLVHLQFDPAGRLVQGLAAEASFLLCEAAGPGDLMGRVRRIE
jgi:hypothetical protein